MNAQWGCTPGEAAGQSRRSEGIAASCQEEYDVAVALADLMARVEHHQVLGGRRAAPLPPCTARFGTRVQVKAVSLRVVRLRSRDIYNGPWAYDSSFVCGTGRPVDESTLESADWSVTDQESRDVVRICRTPLDPWAFGIIVGDTARYEGFRDSNPGGPEDDRQAWLDITLRVPVYQVALDVSLVGIRQPPLLHRAARIVEVQPDDLVLRS